LRNVEKVDDRLCRKLNMSSAYVLGGSFGATKTQEILWGQALYLLLKCKGQRK
jgi:hypothetical protein